MMQHKLFRILVGMTFSILLIGCIPSAATLPPGPTQPAPTQVPPGGSNSTPAAEMIYSYQECLRAAGSLLQEDYDPPQCVTKDGKVFKDERADSAVEVVSTDVSKEGAVGTSASSLSPQGPWLVYRHNALSLGYADVGPIPEEFVFLNQDATGRISITLPECNEQINAFLMVGDNAANAMANIGGDIYIFRPSQAAGMLVYRQLWYSDCQTYFSGDAKSGLLAAFYQAAYDVSPELILYELPGGKIRERFPLVRCAEGVTVCNEFQSNWSEMMMQKPQWSPNGRYLAFTAILDAASSDLFVYDSQDGSLRRLTDGPDWVGPIEWSPDGTRIIMQELLNDNEFLFTPYSKPPTSVWSVSVSGNEIKQLYAMEEAFAEQNIEFWLDDQHFISYEGFLVNADQARGLRLVDTEAGTSRILFPGVFVMLSFDPVHEMFAIYEQNTEICLPGGICLVSLKDGTIRPLKEFPHFWSMPWWDEKSGLFVSGDDCENDPQSFQAVNYQGTFTCVPKSEPTSEPPETASDPAPDGKQRLTLKDGLWLESESGEEIQVSQETASDVTWCPDSTCFFFSVPQPDGTWTLYHVSLPGLAVTKVDDGIRSTGSYQWLGGER